jgi:hypothetical protein
MSALLKFLVEFEVARPGTVPEALPDLGGDLVPLDPEEAPALDLALDLDLAPLEPQVDPVAEAVAAALAEAAVAQAAALEQLAERHAADLAEARARWVAEEAAPLADGFRQAMAALEETLADAAGAALEPLVGEALRLVTVRELRAAIADLVTAGLGGRIALSGQADLIDALVQALSEAGIDVGLMDIMHGDTAEVSVMADNSAIETRLGAVTDALQRRLGDRS